MPRQVSKNFAPSSFPELRIAAAWSFISCAAISFSPANKADIRPEIVKAKAEEQKAHDKIEKREEGGAVAMVADQAFQFVYNTVKTGAGLQ
jgi:cobyrinic acid a,c-diamide synthase